MTDEIEANETEAAPAVEVVDGETRTVIGEGGAIFEVNWPPAEWLQEKIAAGLVTVVEPAPKSAKASKAAKKG